MSEVKQRGSVVREREREQREGGSNLVVGQRDPGQTVLGEGVLRGGPLQEVLHRVVAT